MAFSYTPKDNNLLNNYIISSKIEKQNRDFGSKVSCLSPIKPKFEVIFNIYIVNKYIII